MSTATEPQAFHLRPRFYIDSQFEIETLHDKFKDALKSKTAPCAGKVRLGFVSLYPLPADKHYWSPHLSLTMEADEEDTHTTRLSALYGPAPEVWTMFVFFYAIIGLAIVIVSVIGFANLSIDEPATILWAIPVLIVAFISMYFVSFMGQKKGHDQVESLYNFLMKVIDSKA